MPQAFIPELAWFKVMLYVATQSSEDLFRMASVCPLFRTLANTPQVWNTISMAKYPDHPSWYHANPAVQLFLQQCRACENPESIFRERSKCFSCRVTWKRCMGCACSHGRPYGSGIYSWTSWHVWNWDALRRRLSRVWNVARHIVDMFYYGKIKFNHCSACNNNEWCFVIEGWPTEAKINPSSGLVAIDANGTVRVFFGSR
ncbi:uncharacterized protein Pyn_23309 [Prunus yedoensis var. nudiflora]|uniref:F-box protein n=1 Tax=Prunus yedoensis var. nudiflora TaxID=2094558 RepID=A0A314Z201_PRUYE|nr:uncharacterized protein Pyn_23309 [Prunus yedoensis var. nudiflora]